MNPTYIADVLLKAQAVVLRPDQPFTFASGIKSPIYCDNRTLYSFPDERKAIVTGYLDLIRHYALEADVIAGVATGAIGWAALVAEHLGKPMIYIRSAPKDHGKQNLIEGKLAPGQKVLVIEDLVTTGGSSVAAVQAVKDAGNPVIACIAVFTYGFAKSSQKFKEAHCTLYSLTDFNTLLRRAAETGYITEQQKEICSSWSSNPETWGV